MIPRLSELLIPARIFSFALVEVCEAQDHMLVLVVEILEAGSHHMVLLLEILDDLMPFLNMPERNIYRVKSNMEIVPRERLLAPHLIYAGV